ncbi:hypothetical protein [Spirosoma endbachense]|uniref:Uncharacterized protein n=1 Tax=Spirosoma endbachense TaxID=2666025 RepID=A0A6P1WAN1_9BACT|nr:hypothetical protein [Spirosoma endbachense]QHW01030.1 hypothetical protein GJR95_41035 [Spirosoma endbachense]
MSSSIKFLLPVIALVIGFIMFWYLVPKSPSFGMFSGTDEVNLMRFALSFLTTIIGVVLGSFYRNLRALQATGKNTIEKPLVFLSEMTRSIDLWLGLVGAPIVYALLLQSTGSMTLPGLLVIALENGFCCLVIINGFVSQTETKVKDSAQPSEGKKSTDA